MPLIVESCSVEELAAALGGSKELLIELRDKLSDWLKLQPHLPQGMYSYFIFISIAAYDEVSSENGQRYRRFENQTEIRTNLKIRVTYSTTYKYKIYS